MANIVEGLKQHKADRDAGIQNDFMNNITKKTRADLQKVKGISEDARKVIDGMESRFEDRIKENNKSKEKDNGIGMG